MKCYRLGIDEIPSFHRLTLLLGTFDGLHRGHYELVKEAKIKGEGDLGVVFFDKNPASILRHKSEKVLTSTDDKIRLFSSFGFDAVFLLPLSLDLLQKSKNEFIEEYIKPLNPSLIVVGEDYSFGYKGEGKVDDLASIFPTSVVPLLSENGEKIGTQEIIRLIENGEIEEANRQLGRAYEIHGKVSHGLQNGRKIGFPTANLELSTPYVLPRTGVYKTLSFVRGIPHLSLTNVGNNPTIGVLKHPVIETFIEGFQGEIYDETLYVSFLSFLREEKKFASLDELKKQIEIDKTSLFD